MIPLVKLPLPDDQDSLFHLTPQANLIFYSHIMDYETPKILVKNASDRPLCVPRRHKLGHLLDMAYENCFLIDTQSAYNVASVPPSSHSFSNLSAGPTLPPTDASMETVLKNGIRMYRDASAVKQISYLVIEYSSIWESQGFVQIPPERWMKIPLKHGWEAKVSAIKQRVYSLDNDTRHLVDNTFDEIHKQRRLTFTTDSTPFRFPVFVV